MRFEHVAVAGVAHVEAPHRIPSEAFEQRLAPTMKRLGLPAAMLREVAGIQARRWWDEGVTPSQAAVLAAEKVLRETGIPREHMGLLVNTSVCRDFIEPSTACLVHGAIGLAPHCLNFDLGNACLAFVNAMNLAATMIESGQIPYAMIVDGEGARFVQEQTLARLEQPGVELADFSKEFATLTLGSGSVAMILGHTEHVHTGHLYRGGVSRAATEWNQLCKGQPDKMETDTRALLAAGVELAKTTFVTATETLGWTPGCLDEIVLHQVSAVHTAKLCHSLGLDPKKALLTFPEYGNIGPASVPFTLSKAVEAGRVVKGSRIGLLGIGSGLNCSMSELRW